MSLLSSVGAKILRTETFDQQWARLTQPSSERISPALKSHTRIHKELEGVLRVVSFLGSSAGLLFLSQHLGALLPSAPAQGSAQASSPPSIVASVLHSFSTGPHSSSALTLDSVESSGEKRSFNKAKRFERIATAFFKLMAQGQLDQALDLGQRLIAFVEKMPADLKRLAIPILERMADAVAMVTNEVALSEITERRALAFNARISSLSIAMAA